MKNIELYNADGLKTLEFKFNDPIIEYQEKYGWAVAKASGRSITINGTPFLGYDDRINNSRILIDFSDSWKNEINEYYKSNDKVLVIFLNNGLPIMFFAGKAISLVKKNDAFAEFAIDGYSIWLHKMNFLILSKDK